MAEVSIHLEGDPAGEYRITPVHWRRGAENRVAEQGMNARPVRWDASTIRVFYGVRGPGNGIFYFDVDPRNPSEFVQVRMVR